MWLKFHNLVLELVLVSVGHLPRQQTHLELILCTSQMYSDVYELAHTWFCCLVLLRAWLPQLVYISTAISVSGGFTRQSLPKFAPVNGLFFKFWHCKLWSLGQCFKVITDVNLLKLKLFPLFYLKLKAHTYLEKRLHEEVEYKDVPSGHCVCLPLFFQNHI